MIPSTLMCGRVEKHWPSSCASLQLRDMTPKGSEGASGFFHRLQAFAGHLEESLRAAAALGRVFSFSLAIGTL